jgi:3-hydroxy-3-methylglutaryl CoA synthase
MTGIASYGVYIPFWRLSRDTIATAWGRSSLGGERSVANNDEDSVTMAVEAVIDCLKDIDRKNIDGLYFASSTAPFREKQCAAIIAAAADLEREIVTIDFGNSLRSGTNALKAAFDAVSSGSAQNIVVAASDCRIAYPKSDYEQIFGDGAAALLISNTKKPVATLETSYFISNDMYDVWRLDKDTYVQSWEERFIIEHGYLENVSNAIFSLLKNQNISIDKINKLVAYAPNSRVQQQLSKRLGLDAQSQLQDLLISNLGICGCAHTLIMLVAALDQAKANDKLLVASYGDGCDTMLLNIADEIQKPEIETLLASKKSLPSYERYLSYRGLLEAQPGEPFRLFPSSTASWRERNSSIRLHGSKCNQCGMITYPIQRICYKCRSKDDYKEIRLSEHKGKIFTFTLDNLAGRSDDPVVPQIVVESELENARIYSMMTDFDPSEITIGMSVEMTFRRIYEGAGMYNYFWKCRPIRQGDRCGEH